MSKFTQQSSTGSLHFIWRLITIMLLIYSCADVSVLEYYEGNISLGIISYRQIFSLNSSGIQSAGRSDRGDSAKFSDSYPHSDTDDLLFEDNRCFCCTAQSAISPIHFAVTMLPLDEKIREPNFHNSQNECDSHSPPYYRPPRFI